jgi:hypothetical protein
LALELFFFAMAVLVLKFPSTVWSIPNQCNMAYYPGNMGCKRFCCCKGVVDVRFSIVLTIAREASSPFLLDACVVLGTVVAFCGADWGIGSQPAIV